MPPKRPRRALVQKVKAIKAARAIAPAHATLEEMLLEKLRLQKPTVPVPTMVGVSQSAPPVWRRIYTNSRKMVFVSGINPIVDYPYTFYFRLFHLNPHSLKLSNFVSALIQIRTDGVVISAVSKYDTPPIHAERHKSDLPPRGFRVAGPIIEEAERFARARGLRYLLLNTTGRKRIDYYKSFGFRTVGRAPVGVDMAKDVESPNQKKE